MSPAPFSPDHIAALERRLHDPIVRRSAQAVGDLLAEDFVEFGASGRIWTRDATIAGLAQEADRTPPTLTDIHVRDVGPGTAIITYRAIRAGEESLRSSLWGWRGGRWQLLFHQGTRAQP